MLKNTLILTTVALALNSNSALAFQGPDPEKQRQRMEQRLQTLQETLSLSEQQVESIRALHESKRTKRKEIAEKYGLKKGQGKPKKQLEPNEHAAFKADMKSLRDGVLAEISNILDDDQFAQWQKMREEMQQKAKQRKRQFKRNS